MVEVKNLTVQYRCVGENKKFDAVKDVSFHIEKGTIVSLIGPNGCGKSTVLKAIARQTEIARGTILLDGKDRGTLSHRQAARVMALLPQQVSAPEDATVQSLVEYGRTPFLRFARGLTAEDRETVRWALKIMGLEQLRDRQVYTLSGGERQRVWLAMCLAQKPQLLLLDEPTTYLDIGTQYETLRLVRMLNRQYGLTVLMVLHDLNQAARFSQKILAMREGRLVGEGSVEQVISADVLWEVFQVTGAIFPDPITGTPIFVPES